MYKRNLKNEARRKNWTINKETVLIVNKNDNYRIRKNIVCRKYLNCN